MPVNFSASIKGIWLKGFGPWSETKGIWWCIMTIRLLIFGIPHEELHKQFLAHKEEAKLLVFQSREDCHCWVNRILWKPWKPKSHVRVISPNLLCPMAIKKTSLELVLQVAHPLKPRWIPVWILSAWLAGKGGTCCTVWAVSLLLLLSPPWFQQAGKGSAPPTRFQVQVEAKLPKKEHFQTVTC